MWSELRGRESRLSVSWVITFEKNYKDRSEGVQQGSLPQKNPVPMTTDVLLLLNPRMADANRRPALTR